MDFLPYSRGGVGHFLHHKIVRVQIAPELEEAAI